ncbi:class I SAM-dependent methyltransferase [Lentzea californiensis]|uniref:class I SAM-dependent methyltransferase n=1 Tax=Lentzea californiensis TaxID=438851 RepID=UPI0021654DC7|nr:class I SAM-dependent methyltransferase [Lentzea californiensis]MCR3752097.1 Methyltransferase domain-containing protein [Lentzea californiensis]
MHHEEIRKLARLEDSHWWYRERRHLLARMIRRLTPGIALDVGAAGGGNTRVLVAHGWRSTAVEHGEEGAAIAAARGLPVVRADACHLPFADRTADLVIAFDVLEHISRDDAAAAEIHRVLKPGGTFLATVPADPRLWSAHDVAVGHVRRYTRSSLQALLWRNGFEIRSCRSWNVLLRPVAAWRRKRVSGSDLQEPHPLVNRTLAAVVGAERYLSVGRWPGVSLLVHARRPQT